MASPESTAVPKTDYRNGDLVSRLLAATPPYLYNMPLVPQSFFFSEMLRSFVQAKSASNQNVSSAIGQRRGRKRSWRESKQQAQSAVITEKPLELTTTSRSSPPPKPCSPPIIPPPPSIPPPPPPLLLPPLPSQSSEIPSPASLWYPPLYTPPNLPPQPPPPYAFDPLHFFIDLRVSGHIWDRKHDTGKDQALSSCEPLNLQTDDKKNELSIESTFRQRKHVSAFSVPQPRESSVSTNNSISIINNSKDVSSHKSATNTIGTNYVLQNLTKIYKEVKISKDSPSTNNDEGSPQDDEKKCKDIRELIGLELVVDYVNGNRDKDKTLVTTLKQETELDLTQDVAVD